MSQPEEIFALDIGTRKVLGIVAVRRDDHLVIVDSEMAEHTRRPMFDGQVHSIDEVVRTVSKVKDALEERLGHRLTKTGVALAGRNLVTYKGTVAREFPQMEEVSADFVRDLEMEAVERIGAECGKDLSEFYCVGYSPVYYDVDGLRVHAPQGHRCRRISTEVIATFLPRIVLDSIFAVLRKVGLEAVNVTLEPIAAMAAIIPQEMRNLNLVLVDIGAGTSDLALSRDGAVFAFDMVPEAGDEITEALSHQMLVDFATAEKIKRSLASDAPVAFEDIWARTHRMSVGSVRELMRPAVQKLSASIARKALELNGGAPRAVVLCGGGSLTDNLIPELALNLTMPLENVGIRLPAAIAGIVDPTKKLSGPESVTPIGILLMTERTQGLRFIEVEVNGEKAVLLDFQQKKDILGALTFSGAINAKKLFPRPGLALTFHVNKELKIIKGTLGEPAKILRNKIPVHSLSEQIQHNDKIEFSPAVNGQDATATVGEILDVVYRRLNFNGQSIEITAPVMMDGRPVPLDEPVHDRAVIEVASLSVADVLRSQGVAMDDLRERQVLINVNGAPKIIPQRNFSVALNGQPCALDTEVKPLDSLEFAFGGETNFRVRDVVEAAEGFDTMRITVDDKDVSLMINRSQVLMNGRTVSADEFIIDGADIRVYGIKEKKVLLSDIFRYIDIDPQQVVGKRIRIFVDDAPAGFTTPISDGSRVRLLFEERDST